jgi:type II secretory pathway pseudopilin PulG
MIKKRYITLLDIMIVILLIGIITSVVGYNVKGSLEKGKIFKTEQAQKQIRDILLLEVAKGNDIDEVVKNHRKHLKDSGLIRDVKQMLKDGWGKEFLISASKDKSDIDVISPTYKKSSKDNDKNLQNNEEENY